MHTSKHKHYSTITWKKTKKVKASAVEGMGYCILEVKYYGNSFIHKIF
jgi:hypothetical protein